MITREKKIEQSVEDYVKNRVFGVANYQASDVVFEDAFPADKFDGPLTLTHVAMVISFDNGGKSAELGSNFITRQHTITFYVFGLDEDWGENVANVVKAAVDADGVIPLKDYGSSNTPAVIDALIVDNASSQRQLVKDARPWERAIWTVVVKITDEYTPSI